MQQKSGKEMVLTGYVTPEDWDDDDNVIAIKISTEEDDYLVNRNKAGKELLQFIDEEVEVTGFVEEDEDGAHHITVISYDVLQLDESDDDMDYDDFYYDEVDFDDPDFEDDRYN